MFPIDKLTINHFKVDGKIQGDGYTLTHNEM